VGLCRWLSGRPAADELDQPEDDQQQDGDHHDDDGRGPAPEHEQQLCDPKTSSTSRGQAVFVDQAADASLSSDAVLNEVDRLG
jgi:hypothetical protein